MSNLKMEELNRRRASCVIIEDTLRSPRESLKPSQHSPQPSIKQNGSRANSLHVAVQNRRASIISTSQDNLLTVAAGHSRNDIFRDASNENLIIMVSFQLLRWYNHMFDYVTDPYNPNAAAVLLII